MRSLPMIAAISLVLFGAAHASYANSPIIVDQARIPASVGAAKTGAGYMVIANHGTTDDRLLAVEAEFPRVEIHKRVETDGISTMVRQDNGVVLPAGTSAAFAPGGLHVMFMGLPDPFVAGESVQAILVFEHAGRLPVNFEVVLREDLGSVGGDHDQSD